MVDADFAKWATGFSGCDGGDVGSLQHRSIWFCGIEWGGGQSSNEEELRATCFSQDVELPDDGYTSDGDSPAWKHCIGYRFNWQAMKLLTAINGGKVSAYKQFAEEIKPFTSGAVGYFKMNLYPLSFKDTDHNRWENGFAQATGLANKFEYLEWIRVHRFPVMKSWVDTYSPRLILCTGISASYPSDFHSAFVDNGLEYTCEIIEGQELKWAVNQNGTLVVVIPFMSNRNGLTKDASVQLYGERIRTLLG
jgi:hypothetical protein